MAAPAWRYNGPSLSEPPAMDDPVPGGSGPDAPIPGGFGLRPEEIPGIHYAAINLYI